MRFREVIHLACACVCFVRLHACLFPYERMCLRTCICGYYKTYRDTPDAGEGGGDVCVYVCLEGVCVWGGGGEM